MTLPVPASTTQTPSRNLNWVASTQFRHLVKDEYAFHICGPKGAGKSTTARNVLGAKLLEGEKFKLRCYAPNPRSDMDSWPTVPAWSSCSQAIEMAIELGSLIATRKRGRAESPNTNFDWVYYVVEELDFTLSSRNGYEVGMNGNDITEVQLITEAISEAAKEGPSLQIGIIICTQTPNVRQLRDITPYLCQIAIGASGLEHLTDSTEASEYRTLLEDQEHCPAVLISQGHQKVIELPPYGEYGLDTLDSNAPQDFQQSGTYKLQQPAKPSLSKASKAPRYSVGSAFAGIAIATGLIGILGAGIAGEIASSAELRNLASMAALTATCICIAGIISSICLSISTTES